MKKHDKCLIDVLAEYVDQSGNVEHDDLTMCFEGALRELTERGKINLLPDYRLGDRALEIRVRQLLVSMNLDAQWGRERKEDIVVGVPSFARPSIPLVIEVKSGKSASTSMRDLRQADDWVFDLSGESKNRQRGIDDPGKQRGYRSKGAMQAAPFDKPKKGVLVFNGEVGTKFDDRHEFRIEANQLDFLEKRYICVISFQCLLSWESAFKRSPSIVQTFWSQVQKCKGVLAGPN